MDGETKKYGSKQVTGFSEYWKANNIYDLAGNCAEWSQEAYKTNCRVRRGGDYYTDGSGNPASARAGFDTDSSSFVNWRFSSYFNNKVALERLTLTL